MRRELIAAAALVAGGCGGSASAGAPAHRTVTIYASFPLQGASKAVTSQIVDAMRLAVDEARMPSVRFVPLDDSTAQKGDWDPEQVAANARKAIQDTTAVAYLGDYNSGASAVSIPITNQGGLAQISPTNTYVGLTTDEPGGAPGEPAKYYPTGKRTYARIVPRDTVQAAALVALMRQDGCRKAAIGNDRDTFGVGLATLVERDAKAAGLTIASNDGLTRESPNYRSYAQKLAGEGADCFLFAGVTADNAVTVFKDVGAALPKARLYGPDGTCESGLTNPADGGIPAALGPRFRCTVATQDLRAYPGGAAFVKAYKTKFGAADPNPYSIYGYEAMRLALDAIRRGGTTRAAFVRRLFATRQRASVLGTYSLDANGDTSIADYGVYEVGPSGDPQFVSKIAAAQ